MNGDEFKQVVAYVAKSQHREFDANDQDIWWGALSDLPFGLVEAGLRTLVRESTDFLTPARVRAAAVGEATNRLAKAGAEPIPPNGLTPQEYLSWRRRWRQEVFEGSSADEAALAAVEAANRVAALESTPSRRPPALPVLRQGRDVIEEAAVGADDSPSDRR